MNKSDNQERRPWVKPEVRRIDAGSAEFGPNNKNDAGTGSQSS